jgi:pilus assembly protein CpaB
MNPNPTRTLWISIGMGIFAMFLIYSYSQEKKAEYDRRYGTSKRVLVASKDILEMSTVDETMVEFQEFPVDFIQPGAISEPDLVFNKVASAPIKKGEQILNTKLLSLGANTGLSTQVAPGKRAVAIPIDETRGVSKLLQPGDRIDILASVEVGKGPNKEVEVKTIMQDVVVLATGLKITNNIPRLLEKNGSNEAVFRNLNGDTNFGSITIEANPTEAQNLVYMMTTSPGSLFVTLRNPNDRIVSPMGNSDTSSVLGKYTAPTYNVEPPVAQVAPVPPPAKVQSRMPSSLPQKRKGSFIEVR